MNRFSKNNIDTFLFKEKSIAPLVTFRILFGALMGIGAMRFMLSGWIEKLYGEPIFFFKYYGFEWVVVPNLLGCYLLYSFIALSAFGIMFGAFYRLATILFFLSFTYSELLDLTNYLNHYYLVILLAFLLIFIPANRFFSIDVWRKPQIQQQVTPAWTIYILIFQLTVVYTFAGIAKLNPDWLFRAMPLAIWLPERSHLPILGYFFQFKVTAFLFSWFGAFYDLTVAYFLLFRKTRPFAYFFVIVFHVITKILFNIGLFPFIMIFSTLIFFSEKWHKNIIFSFKNIFQKYISFFKNTIIITTSPTPISFLKNKTILKFCLLTYIITQLVLPFRYLPYPNHLFWSEEGYRFSWRVMLVEKQGIATFTVADTKTNRKSEIVNGNYLTRFQEKQMAIQPDFILQFAHFLKKEYETKHGFVNPIITVDAHVALNGNISKRFIDPTVNLATIKESFYPKKWVLNY